MRYVIQHEPTKMDIQAETQQELIEKLKYLNPMFLRIAQQCLEKKYRLSIKDSGEKLFVRPLKPIAIQVISVDGKLIKSTTFSGKNIDV